MRVDVAVESKADMHLLDDVVGAPYRRQRHSQVERSCGLAIDEGCQAATRLQTSFS
jgi:hypothetical protein